MLECYLINTIILNQYFSFEIYHECVIWSMENYEDYLVCYIYMYCSTALYNVLYDFEDVDALAKPYSIESVVDHRCKNGLETG